MKLLKKIRSFLVSLIIKSKTTVRETKHYYIYRAYSKYRLYSPAFWIWVLGLYVGGIIVEIFIKPFDWAKTIKRHSKFRDDYYEESRIKKAKERHEGTKTRRK